jgi:hypothetical protein
MDQEMGMVFKKLNANGQLVAACGTLMSKNPVPLKLQKPLVCNRSAKLVSDSLLVMNEGIRCTGGGFDAGLSSVTICFRTTTP